jgi:lysophospholipase L1-like esterase
MPEQPNRAPTVVSPDVLSVESDEIPEAGPVAVTPLPGAPPKSPKRSLLRRLTRALVTLATLALISVASIAFSLQVTPLQSVSALGQTVGVGAASPTASFSGPGEVELFGQSLPTNVRFVGPVRPKLVLTDITINEQVAGLFSPETRDGSAAALGDQLAAGWKRYFGWEIAFVAVGSLLLLGIVAGWRRHAWSWKRTLATVAGGLVIVEAINLGLIMLTAYTAPDILKDVQSLGGLVGHSEEAPLPAAPGPPLHGIQAVVIGDSTAAGVGNAPLPDPTKLDEVCGRSTDAYAVHLADVNRWNVKNLACSSATIRDGILGPQFVGGQWIPPQLAVAKKAIDASAVVISVGANDMDWGPMIRLCAASDTCDDRASTAFFQRSLALFTRDYYELLRQLSSLPKDTRVVINLYYAPFDTSADCLTGLTEPKIEVLLERLGALNAVLAEGAKTFRYLAVQPDFSGHGLCTQNPYVQGLEDQVPFHPNATGELVIALADERALLGAP